MTRQAWAVILWTGMALSVLPGCNFLRGGCDTSTVGSTVVVDDQHPKGPADWEESPTKKELPPRPPEPLPFDEVNPPRRLLNPGGPTALLTGQAKDRSPLDMSQRATIEGMANYPTTIPGLNNLHGPETPGRSPQEGAVARAEAPPAPREPLVRSLEKFLQHQPPDEAIKDLKEYDAESQEFFLRLLPILAQLTQKKLSQLDHQETVLLYNQLENLLVALRSQSDLLIDQMCFCERIDGFGMYKPLPENYTFRAATADQPGERVQIYAQLRNLGCEKRGPCYETRLSTSVKVVDQQGVSQWYLDMNDRTKPLHSQMPRHDYYSGYVFLVPHLRPGTYTLVVQIRDVTRPGCERVARQTLPFRVAQ